MSSNQPGAATAPRPAPAKSRENDPTQVIVNFDKIPPDERKSILCHMVCQQTLPIAIRMTKSYVPRGSQPVLKKGELLLLLEIPMLRGGDSRSPCYIIKSLARMRSIVCQSTQLECSLALWCFHKLPVSEWRPLAKEWPENAALSRSDVLTNQERLGSIIIKSINYLK